MVVRENARNYDPSSPILCGTVNEKAGGGIQDFTKLVKKGEETMASKINFGYYDENGKDPNAYDRWNAWVDPATGKNKTPGAHYVKFKSEEEKQDFVRHLGESGAGNGTGKETLPKSVLNEGSDLKAGDGRSEGEILREEREMIANGEWEKYLFDNITCENLAGYDALCVSDASYNDQEEVGSFGLIVIPLKAGKMDGDIIVESAYLKDIDNMSFERVCYDMKCSRKSETINLDNDLIKILNGKGYVASGYADRAESESATRVIEICEDNKWKKIVYISDCQPLLQAINKGESKAAGNIRTINKKKEWGGSMLLRRVGSHKKAIVGEINEVGANKDAVGAKYFDRDKSRLYALLNDLADLMAKAELKAKGGNAQSENKCSIHLIPKIEPDESYSYPKSGAESDMNKIYDAGRPEYDRRAITREMVTRVMPLIKRAISNGILQTGQ